MLRLLLLYSCFLFSLAESRHIAVELVTWPKSVDDDVTLDQTPNLCLISFNESAECGLVEVKELDSKRPSGCGREDSSKGEVEAIVKLKSEKLVEAAADAKAETEVRARLEATAETETETNAQEEVEAKAKTRSKLTKKGAKSRSETEGQKTEVKMRSKFRGQKEVESKTEAEAREISKTNLAVGIKPRPANVELEAILQFQPEGKKCTIPTSDGGTDLVPVLEPRESPRSLLSFKPDNASLSNRGAVSDSGFQSIRPLLEWMKTTCPGLQTSYNVLIWTFRKLVGGLGTGRVRTPSRQPKSTPRRLPKSPPKSPPEETRRGNSSDDEIEKLRENALPAENKESKIPSKSPQKSPSKALQESPSMSPLVLPPTAPQESRYRSPEKTSSMSPQKSPTQTPQESPSKTPQESPPMSPQVPPSKAPPASRYRSPEKTSSKSPQESPSKSPQKSPSKTPQESPSKALQESPSMSPQVPPSKAPPASRHRSPEKTSSKSPPKSPQEDPKKLRAKEGNGHGFKVADSIRLGMRKWAEMRASSKKGAVQGTDEVPPIELGDDQRGGAGGGTSPPKSNGGRPKGGEDVYAISYRDGFVANDAVSGNDVAQIRPTNGVAGGQGGRNTGRAMSLEERAKEMIGMSSAQVRGRQFRDPGAWGVLESRYGKQKSK